MSIWASRASITLRLDVLGDSEASCCLTRDAARQLARELLAWADSDAPAWP